MVEPQYDQSDSDAFYLAEENRKLRAQLADAEKRRIVAVTARCSSCGSFCDDIQFEYEGDQ